MIDESHPVWRPSGRFSISINDDMGITGYNLVMRRRDGRDDYIPLLPNAEQKRCIRYACGIEDLPHGFIGQAQTKEVDAP